jgi:hypothetical protein
MRQPGKCETENLVRHKRSKHGPLVRLEINNALDNSRRFVRSLAVGYGHFLYRGRTHPHPSARSFGRPGNQPGHGPKTGGLTGRREAMKPIFLVGSLLIVLGGLALAYQGFNYTHQEKVLDVGPIHATKEEHEHVSIPPILGGLALVGGIVMVVAAGRKNS